jgi:hypothetical protein
VTEPPPPVPEPPPPVTDHRIDRKHKHVHAMTATALPPPRAPLMQTEVFATLHQQVEKIQNSDFGKRPSITRILKEIDTAVQELEPISIGREIPQFYLFGLTVDAWMLGNVAAAVSADSALLFPPVPEQPMVAVKSFTAWFLAPRSDQDQKELALAWRKAQVFPAVAVGRVEKELAQPIQDVDSDLSAKRNFAVKNPSDPFGSVVVEVTTRNKENSELSGYEVWYSLKGLLKHPEGHNQFDRASSPTSYPLPPGNYVFWARGGSAEGPKRELKDLGSDGQHERAIDPLLTP